MTISKLVMVCPIHGKSFVVPCFGEIQCGTCRAVEESIKGVVPVTEING